MKTRIITAIILLPLFLAAIIYLSPLYFSILIALMMLLGAWEWSAFIGFDILLLRFVYVALIGLGIFFSAGLPIWIMLLVALCFWVWSVFAIILYEKNAQINSAAGFQLPIIKSLSGFFMLIACWDSFVFLKSDPRLGASWLIYILLIIFAADTGAYFAGKFFGKKLLAPRVSPKKTIEGLFGGLFLSFMTAIIYGLFLHLSLQHYIYLILLSLVCAVFSVLGDLFESLLKRMANIKDSGRIFPGHGGLLDRADSVLSATVVFSLGILLCNL